MDVSTKGVLALILVPIGACVVMAVVVWIWAWIHIRIETRKLSTTDDYTELNVAQYLHQRELSEWDQEFDRHIKQHGEYQ